jgi:CheY-like chemotaxis protein
LGIGLALVKNLVEMHGGGVSAASDGPGRGSTFVIRVPGGRRAAAGDDGPSATGERGGPEPVSRGHAAGTALDPGRHRVEEPGIAGRRVLLVDDNVDGVQALAELLRECGHRVEAVFDPASALRLVPRFEPEIAVIDIGLPGMDGYELVRRLRAEQASRPCLFVALTGYGQDADRQRSRAAGFHHHFVKPLDPGQLLSLIDGVTPRIDTSAA